MKQKSKSGLFLMELILSILIFSLCSAVCVQLFVQAHLTEQRASDLSKAILLCETTAAMIQSGENSPEMEPSFYDSTFQPCDASDAVWQLTVSTYSSENVPCVHICVTDWDSIQAVSDSYSPSVLYEIYAGY